MTEHELVGDDRPTEDAPEPAEQAPAADDPAPETAAPEPAPEAAAEPVDAEMERPPEPEDEAETALETAPGPEAEPAPEATPDPEPAPEADAAPEPEAEPAPGAAPEAEPTPDADAEAAPEPEADAGPEPEAEPAPDAAPEAEPTPDAEAETAPEAEPAPDAAAAPEAEPTPDAEAETAPEAEPAPGSRPVADAAAGDDAVGEAAPASGPAATRAGDAVPDVTPAPAPNPPSARRPTLRQATPAERPPDLRLATLHLRVGMLGLARAELEAAAGGENLDESGILDLAEVRWRTGDQRGAAAAATAWLDACPPSARAASQEALAHVVLAEAAATRGRDDEVATHARAALDALGAIAGWPTAGSKGRRGLERRSVESLLDDVFAGIEPYATVWPAVGRTAASPARTAIAPTPPSAPPAASAEPARAEPAPAEPTPALAIPAEAENRSSAGPVHDPAQVTLWGAEPAPVVEAAAAPAPSPTGARPDAGATLASAMTALPSDPDRAAILFLLALRSGGDPATVLLSIGDDGGQPALALVRAEALAAIGRYTAAAEVLASAGLASAGGPEPVPVMDEQRSGDPD